MKPLVIVVLVLAGCTSANRVPLDYDAADAGRVIVGLGMADFLPSYELLFREAVLAEDKPGRQGSFSLSREDLAEGPASRYSHETSRGTDEGIVLVASLPPGEYEIYNFRIERGDESGRRGPFRLAREPFSVKFAVAPGETTYLANFQANKFVADGRTGIYFVVEDRFEQDVILARQSDPSIPQTVGNQAITARDFDSIFFIRPDQQDVFPE